MTTIMMPPHHQKAFLDAARRANSAILVRQSNPESFKHVAKPHAVPKRIDCKAKTADFGFQAADGRYKDVAGLVVDPDIAGPQAFKSARYASAKEEWLKFKATFLSGNRYGKMALSGKTYVPNGGIYFVEFNSEDPFYGCVKCTTSSLITAGKVIHGDYDLYGIVPMDDPGTNIRTTESLAGQNHARGRKFINVQTWVNQAIGVPMILHGSQEKYASKHSDEAVDVFFPTGETLTVVGVQAIETLYRDRFKGRQLFPKSDRFVQTKRFHPA